MAISRFSIGQSPENNTSAKTLMHCRTNFKETKKYIFSAPLPNFLYFIELIEHRF
jgi:FMN-dependent NADH-azoreductase